MQGKSFVHLLDDPDQAFREVAYSHFKSGDAVTTRRYSYTRYKEGGEMLYDLVEDPEENQNLADHPDHADQCSEMRGLSEMRQAEAAAAGKLLR